MINFTNCCTAMSGWGKSMGLSSCSGEEKNLAKKKEKKLCHYVGKHCAEKGPFGICLRQKQTYCCFASKISRLFHEQGRPQLGKNWGTSKDPDCSAFSVEELTKLDFSKMDLSELYADLFQNVSQKALKTVPHQLKDQMPTAQKKLKERGDHAMSF